MAVKADPAVAKARQQKMILIFGAVILAGLLVLQGPKLMKQLNGSKATTASSSTTTTPASSSSDTSSDTAPAPVTTGSTPVPAIAIGATSGPATNVAGVVLRAAASPAPTSGQLFSVSTFKLKDPFVQVVKDGSGATGDTGGSGGTTTASGGATTGSTTGTVVTPTTSTPVAFAYATVMVNGKPQQLTLKQVFPKGEPTFVLRGVDKNSIKIAVAGGKFTGGGVINLERGKTVTLMNTTTGQRFVMKLVFTGDQPEQIAVFKQPGATTGQTTTSTQTTTASTP